jgi:hypothetical protein
MGFKDIYESLLREELEKDGLILLREELEKDGLIYRTYC